MFGFENVRKSRKIINDLLTTLLFYLFYVLNHALFINLRAGSLRYVTIVMAMFAIIALSSTVQYIKKSIL
jgi:hypothetical protein